MGKIGRRHFLTSVAALSLSACAGPAKSAGAAKSIDITTALLGQGEAAASGWLASRRIKGGQSFGRYRIYETPVFERVFDRQRLVLNLADGALQSVFVIISPGFADEAEKTFTDVFRQLLAAYGRPAYSRERGRFTRKVATDLRTGAFRREHEWRVPGGDLRLCIPKRIDRQVRVEVHFVRRLALTTQSDWSVEVIR